MAADWLLEGRGGAEAPVPGREELEVPGTGMGSRAWETGRVRSPKPQNRGTLGAGSRSGSARPWGGHFERLSFAPPPCAHIEPEAPVRVEVCQGALLPVSGATGMCPG